MFGLPKSLLPKIRGALCSGQMMSEQMYVQMCTRNANQSIHEEEHTEYPKKLGLKEISPSSLNSYSGLK